jgi:hypothetical protein
VPVDPARGGLAVTPRAKSSLLWGVVGVFAFLVVVQGYDLFVPAFRASLGVRVTMALVAGAATAGLAYALEHRLARKGRT